MDLSALMGELGLSLAAAGFIIWNLVKMFQNNAKFAQEREEQVMAYIFDRLRKVDEHLLDRLKNIDEFLERKQKGEDEND